MRQGGAIPPRPIEVPGAVLGQHVKNAWDVTHHSSSDERRTVYSQS